MATGRVYEITSTGDTPLFPKGYVQLVSGRTYRVTSDVFQSAKPANNAGVLATVSLYGLSGTFTAATLTATTANVVGTAGASRTLLLADGWQRLSVDITISAGNTAAYARPRLMITANPSGSVVQVANLKIEDVSESVRAFGYADAAATSASTASTKATDAGNFATAAQNSATAASTSAGAANTSSGAASTSAQNASTSESNAAQSAGTATTQANLASSARLAAQGVANQIIPVRPAVKTNFISPHSPANGTPEGAPDMTLGTIVNVASEGDVLQVATSRAIMATRGWLPVSSGRTFRVEHRYRTTVDGTSNTPWRGFLIYSATGGYINSVQWATDAIGGTVAEGWVSRTKDVTSAQLLAVDPSAAYVRAAFAFNSNGTGDSGATMQLSLMRFTDVTSEVASLNSANAANTSAGLADTKATAAGNSATAANNSALAAQSTFISNNLLTAAGFPDRYDGVGQYFLSNAIGSPTTAVDLPSNGTATGYGPIRTTTLATSNQTDFATRSVLTPVPGRIYKLEAEFTRTAISGTANSSTYANLALRSLDAAYADLGGANHAATPYTGSLQTVSGLFSNVADASAGIYAWPAGSVWLRPYLRLYAGGATSITVEIRRLTVTDVTERMVSQNSASAAATSATNAGTQATNAGNSANAAQNAALTATSQSAYGANYVSGNLVSRSTFEDGLFAPWTSTGVTVVNVTTPSGAAFTKALYLTARDCTEPDILFREGNFNARTYRITGWVKNDSSVSARVGVMIKKADGTNVWFLVDVAPASEGVWKQFSVDVAVTQASARMKPWISNNGSPGTDTLASYWAAIRFEDITAQKAATDASGSASAAATSASAADTKATQAGNSATAANTSAIAASSSFTSTNLLASGRFPDRYDGVGQFFIGGPLGSPSTAADLPSNAVVTGYGAVREITASQYDFAPRGVLPVILGRVYKVEVEYQRTVGTGTSFTINIRGLKDDYTDNGASGVAAPNLDGTVQVASRLFSDTADATNNITAWPVGSTWLRPYVRGGAASTTIQIRRLSISDVTESLASKNSSTAAANSATTAGTKATDAGNSATAASQAAVNAASSYGSARLAGGALFPSDFTQKSMFWQNGSSGAPGSVAAFPDTEFTSLSGIGTVYSTNNFRVLAPINVIKPIANRTYEIEVGMKVVTANTASGSSVNKVEFSLLDDAYSETGVTGTAVSPFPLSQNNRPADANFAIWKARYASATPPVYIRPRIVINWNAGSGPNGNASVQVSYFKVTDVTDTIAAANAATAAVGSASDASTSATAAGNSATAASTSAVNAESSFGNTNLLTAANFPDRYDGVGKYFTEMLTGSPTTVTDLPSNATVSSYGAVRSLNVVSGTAQNFATRAVMAAVEGRVYKVEVEFQRTAVSGSTTTATANLGLMSLNDSFSALAGNAISSTNTFTGSVQTLSALFYSPTASPDIILKWQTGASWLRPYIFFDCGSAASMTIQVRRMTVKDVTERVDAANSATAAATSATTAGTKATDAGNSATIASTNAINAASSFTATNLLTAGRFPDRFDAIGQYFTYSLSGSPSSATDLPANTTISGYGLAREQTVTSGNIADVATRAVLAATPGRIYKVEAEFQRTAVSGTPDGNTNIYLAMRQLDGSYAQLATFSVNATAVGYNGTVQTTSAMFSSAANVPAGIFGWTAGTVWLRPWVRVQCGGATSLTVQIRRLTVTDVTEVVNTASSASAAAQSASDASTSATLAGTKADSATTSANNASTSAGNAQTSATAASTSAANSQTSADAAQTSAAAASSSAIVAASAGQNALVRNPTFADYPSATGSPTGWTMNGATPTRVTGEMNIGYAVRQVSGAGVNAWFEQQTAGGASNSIRPNGWYVVEADLRLNAGDLTGAGILFRIMTDAGTTVVDNIIKFVEEKDSTDAPIGTGTVGTTYRVRKLIQAVGAGASRGNLFAMSHWTSIGSIASSNDLTWYRCSLRSATDQEVASRVASNNLAALTANVQTVANAAASLQGRSGAFWQTDVNSGSGSAAFISARADTSNPALAALTLINKAGVAISGRSVTKVALGQNWDSSAHSVESYTGSAYVSFGTNSLGKKFMVGLNTDPDTDASYTSLDYAIYLDSNSVVSIFQSGTQIATYGAASTNDTYSITYSGTTIVYAKNGVTLRTTTGVTAGLTFYLDTSFSEPLASATNLVFGAAAPSTTSSVSFGASEVHILNPTQAGDWKKALSVVNGEVKVEGRFTAGQILVSGNGNTTENQIPAGVYMGSSGSTVATVQSQASNSFAGTAKYRSTGAPTNNPAPSGITVTQNSNGTCNIRLDWAAYTQGTLQADWMIIFWRKDATAPTQFDTAVSFNANVNGASYYVFEGVSPADIMSFGIAAARRTENGLEIGTIQSPTSAPNWRGVGGTTPNFTANVGGVAAGTVSTATVNFNTRNDRMATAISSPILKSGSDIDHTINRDGSCNLAVEWGWSGSSADIDGFTVTVRQGATGSGRGSASIARDLFF